MQNRTISPCVDFALQNLLCVICVAYVTPFYLA